jgi:hypothetical protein
MGSRDSAGSTGVALKLPSVPGVALKFPPTPYTQSEAVRAPTDVTGPPTSLIGHDCDGPALRSEVLLAQESW